MFNFIATVFSPGYINSSVALFVGTFVLIIYWKSKFDYKKEAANIILLEIQGAERQIKQIKEQLAKNKEFLPDIFILPNENWSKYNYLFFLDLKRDEWDIITDFYKTCMLYDQAVTYNNSFFQKNEQEIRVNTKRVISNYVEKYLDMSETKNTTKQARLFLDMNTKINDFISEYMKVNTTNPSAYYAPRKPIEDGNIFMSSIDTNISLISIGSKLERIGSRKFLFLLK